MPRRPVERRGDSLDVLFIRIRGSNRVRRYRASRVRPKSARKRPHRGAAPRSTRGTGRLRPPFRPARGSAVLRGNRAGQLRRRTDQRRTFPISRRACENPTDLLPAVRSAIGTRLAWDRRAACPDGDLRGVIRRASAVAPRCRRRTQVDQGDGLQIRYSWVRIPPPPVMKNASGTQKTPIFPGSFACWGVPPR